MFYGWQEVTISHVAGCLEFTCQLLSDPNKWVYWPIAIDSTGAEIEPTSDKATKWSLIGATEKYAFENYERPLADCIACATREFLNDLTENSELLHGKLQYQEEINLLRLAIEEIQNENT